MEILKEVHSQVQQKSVGTAQDTDWYNEIRRSSWGDRKIQNQATSPARDGACCS